MNRVCLAAVILAASSGVASAGTYLGLGVGTGPELGSDTMELESTGRSLRGMLGFRFGKLSVEGAVGGFDIVDYEGRQASVSGKLNLALGDGFEAFGRAGMQRTWLNNDRPIYNVSGSGYVFGAGIEYRVKLPIGATSLWMDYQYSSADLEGERHKYDLSARMWTLGLSVGL